MNLQYRFEQFKLEHAGEFDLLDDFCEMKSCKERENEKAFWASVKEIVGSVEVQPGHNSTPRKRSAGQKSTAWLRDKFDKHIREYNLFLSTQELAALAQEKINHRDDSSKDAVDYTTYLGMFVKPASKQNLGEAFCDARGKDVEKLVPNFRWVKLYQTYLSDGKIYKGKKPQDLNIKSLDYEGYLGGDMRIIAAQKRMKIVVGGHQKNQVSELERFADESKKFKSDDGRSVLFLAILDGPPQPGEVEEITRRNDQVIVVQSTDLLYLVKFIESKKGIAVGCGG